MTPAAAGPLGRRHASRMRTSSIVLAATAALTLTACPKPPADPVPADTYPVDGKAPKPIEQPKQPEPASADKPQPDTPEAPPSS